MTRYLNFTDLLLIAVSAYIVIWAGNAMLRRLQMEEYQA